MTVGELKAIILLICLLIMFVRIRNGVNTGFDAMVFAGTMYTAFMIVFSGMRN